MKLSNLWHFINLVLRNQSGSVGETDYDMSSYMGDDAGGDDGQAGSGTEESAQEGEGQPSEELSLEDQLNNLNVEAGDGADYLDKINALGLIHNGLPFEVESEDSLKELIMKGNDYTIKTQELANERRDIESQLEEQTQALETRIADFEKQKTEFHQMEQEYNVFQNILEQVRDSYPDVFQEMQSAFNQSMAMYNNAINNPVINQYNQKISELEQKLNGFENTNVEKQATGIKEEWENGLKEVQTNWGAKLKTLGIKPNWADVQKVWQSDTSKTMSVQSALLAQYGDQITKALESQKKLTETKSKSALRLGTEPVGTQSSPQEKKSIYRGDAYTQALEEIAKAQGI